MKQEQITVVTIIVLQAFVKAASANLYDPHVYPNKGPFFEGWYARLTDAENSRSFGVLFGRVLPGSNDTTSAYSNTYLGFVRSRGYNESMEVVDIFPDGENISVTVRGGQEVTADPDKTSPSYFEWVAKPFGYFNVTPNSTVFDFQAEGVRFKGNFETPVQWGPKGDGKSQLNKFRSILELENRASSRGGQGAVGHLNLG